MALGDMIPVLNIAKMLVKIHPEKYGRLRGAQSAWATRKTIVSWEAPNQYIAGSCQWIENDTKDIYEYMLQAGIKQGESFYLLDTGFAGSVHRKFEDLKYKPVSFMMLYLQRSDLDRRRGNIRGFLNEKFGIIYDNSKDEYCQQYRDNDMTVRIDRFIHLASALSGNEGKNAEWNASEAMAAREIIDFSVALLERMPRNQFASGPLIRNQATGKIEPEMRNECEGQIDSEPAIAKFNQGIADYIEKHERQIAMGSIMQAEYICALASYYGIYGIERTKNFYGKSIVYNPDKLPDLENLQKILEINVNPPSRATNYEL